MTRKFPSFILISLAAGMVASSGLFAQTADDPNEGTKLEYDSTNEIWRFKWWGRTGSTYFLQHSEDLQQWNWLPVVESGNDAVLEWGLTTTGEKFFVRLQYTDDEEGDAENGDFDNDGVANLAEVQQGTNPFSNVDTDGDGFSDDLETSLGTDPNDFFNGQPARLTIVDGNNQGDFPGLVLARPLAVRVANQAGTPKPAAMVVFSLTGGGGTVSPLDNGLTDATGIARASLQLPTEVGTVVTVSASFGGVSVEFSASVGDANQGPNAPGAPKILQNPGETTSLVRWEDRSNNENGFHIERSTDNQNWSRIATVPANTLTFSDSGLIADRPYSYRIVAYNDAP